MSEYNDTGGLTRIVRAFGYSLQGFRACYRHEAAFRQEVLAAAVVIPLGLWLGDGG
ncbi:MAG: diacylglycerol kinase, partial [Gammaproteobacteria bacterium]|nr:diacylglycerol kinase [Gammaproteobacteria bacterium]